MRFRRLFVSSLFAVGLLLLPFSYVPVAPTDDVSSVLSIQVALAQDGGEQSVWSFQNIWQSVMRQVNGVLDFTAQAIQAVTDAPSEFFDVASNNPPETSDDVINVDPLINAENLLPAIAAPQIYDGTLIVNIPFEVTERLTVSGFSQFGDVNISGELSLAELTVSGTGSFGGVAAGGGQFGSLNVSGNTQLNTLSVSGPVSFAFLTAGSLTVNNSLSALGGITTQGADVNLQGGNIFAANVINEIIAGDNIQIGGTPNAPIISADIPSLGSRVRSLNGESGTLTLVAGDDVSITDLTISNTSDLSTVRARGGCAGCILDADVADALTIASGTINSTVIGAITPALATFTNITVTDVATSTFGGSIDVTNGCVAINGVCLGGGVAQLNDLLDVTIAGPQAGEALMYDGAEWTNTDLASLGFGDGTFLGLADTPDTYLAAGAIMYVNSTSSGLTQSSDFVFNGIGLAIGTDSPVDTLTVDGDIGILNEQQIHFYDASDSFYVGFRASSTLTGNTIWTLPAIDGNPDQLLITDGFGNLSFTDVTALGIATELDDLSDVTLATTTQGDLLMYDGAVWVNQPTSTLGLGDGTFLGLSDTPSAYIANALVAADGAGNALVQSTHFTFNGTQVAIGSTAPVTTLTVAGDVSVLGEQTIRLYDSNSSNYVGFQASTTLSGDVVWVLPSSDGLVNQVLVTDGSGNLRFEDVSVVGGGASNFLDLTDTPNAYIDGAIPYTDTDELTFSSDLVFDGTHLGIGTDSPAEELTVFGGMYVGFDGTTPGIVYNDLANAVSIGTTNADEKLNIEGGSIDQRGGRVGSTYEPSFVDSLNLSGPANKVVVAGNRAYAVTSAATNNFAIIDITDKTDASIVSTLTLAAGVNDVHVAGKYAYAVSDVTGNDFHVIDISNPSAPVEVRSINLDTTASAVTVRGRYAYVTSAATGEDFHVIDIIDPLTAYQVGEVDLGGNGNDVEVMGNYAFVAVDTLDLFAVVDISNPATPFVETSLPMPSDAEGLVLRGDYAYVATSPVGNDFHIIDISDPTSLSSVSSIGFTAGATELAIAGSYAYVTTAGTNEDLRVVDISDISAPVEVGGVDIPAGSASSVTVVGRYAYLTSAALGNDFHIYDVTGLEAQSVLAHSMESGSLAVLGEFVASGDVMLSESVRIRKGGIQTDGTLLVQGSEASYFTGNLAIGTSTAPQALTVEGDASITGSLYDSSASVGAYGQLLMSTGVGQVWTPTTSLGLSEAFSTSDDLAALLSDESGTAGSIVFSVSPTFTGTVEMTALSVSSTLAFIGTAANISLGSNYLSGDGDDEGVFVDGDGLVGIGTSTPSSALTVEGAIQASNLFGGASDITVDAQGNIIRFVSDERLKTNVEPLENALEKILALRGVSYKWIDAERFGPQTEIGFIAQEVDLVIPEAVRKGGDYWSLDTRNIMAVVVGAIQEIWITISGQKEKIETLENRIQHLETLLEVEVPATSTDDDGNIENDSDGSGSENDVSGEDVIVEEEEGGDDSDGDGVVEVTEEENENEMSGDDVVDQGVGNQDTGSDESGPDEDAEGGVEPEPENELSEEGGGQITQENQDSEDI